MSRRTGLMISGFDRGKYFSLEWLCCLLKVIYHPDILSCRREVAIVYVQKQKNKSKSQFIEVND